MQIRKAEIADLDALVKPFLAYHEFYKRHTAPDQARAFLAENIRRNRSVIFIALNDAGEIAGFTQLYERLSSLSMTHYLYLSDLYVDSNLRRNGVARALMNQAKTYATSRGASSIQLETAHTNKQAQRLYESLGYSYETEYRSYYLGLNRQHGAASDGADQFSGVVPSPAVSALI